MSTSGPAAATTVNPLKALKVGFPPAVVPRPPVPAASAPPRESGSVLSAETRKRLRRRVKSMKVQNRDPRTGYSGKTETFAVTQVDEHGQETGQLVTTTPTKIATFQAKLAGLPQPRNVCGQAWDIKAFGSMQALVRARMEARGVGIDSWLDTLIEAQKTARYPTGSDDHKTRMKSVEIQMNAAGVIGPMSRPDAQVAAGPGQMSREEIDLTGDDLLIYVLRRANAALSNVPLDQVPMPVLGAPKVVLPVQAPSGQELIIPSEYQDALDRENEEAEYREVPEKQYERENENED